MKNLKLLALVFLTWGSSLSANEHPEWTDPLTGVHYVYIGEHYLSRAQLACGQLGSDYAIVRDCKNDDGKVWIKEMGEGVLDLLFENFKERFPVMMSEGKQVLVLQTGMRVAASFTAGGSSEPILRFYDVKTGTIKSDLVQKGAFPSICSNGGEWVRRKDLDDPVSGERLKWDVRYCK